MFEGMETPLTRACKYYNVEIVKMLLATGQLNVNHQAEVTYSKETHIDTFLN
jgi:hypothetical protein